jgi:hypothetical protein
MKTVHKFVLGLINPVTAVQLPIKHKVLHVDEQHGEVTLWVELNTAHATQTHYFQIVGTGHPVPDGAEHVGTALVRQFVWHVYKV